jgi:hypothetical protein
MLRIKLLDSERIVEELMAGVGKTKEEATIFAVHDLVETVVAPVVVMIFPDVIAKAELFEENLVAGKTIWKLKHGRVCSNETTKLSSFFSKYPPVSMIFLHVQEQLNASQMHWVKIFYARMKNDFVSEVRIDNVVHVPASEQFKAVQFPPVDRIVMRQFLFFAPQALVELV